MKLPKLFSKILRVHLFFLMIASCFLYSKPISKNSEQEREQDYVSQPIKAKFRGFKTNLNKRSIDLNLILDGGPGKDGIPAINNPTFRENFHIHYNSLLMHRFWEIAAATIEDFAFGIRCSRVSDRVGRRVCLSGASYAAAEKSEWRMALKI